MRRVSIHRPVSTAGITRLRQRLLIACRHASSPPSREPIPRLPAGQATHDREGHRDPRAGPAAQAEVAPAPPQPQPAAGARNEEGKTCGASGPLSGRGWISEGLYPAVFPFGASWARGKSFCGLSSLHQIPRQYTARRARPAMPSLPGGPCAPVPGCRRSESVLA